MGDGSSIVQVEDVPQVVFETLVNEYGHTQQHKHTGYAVSQSLTELMHYLEPDQVVAVKSEASPISKEESFKGMTPDGAAAYCVDVRECLTTEIKLNYDYSKYGEFPWKKIQEFLNMETTPVDDLAVRSMTISLESEQLRDQIRHVLNDMGLSDTKYLKNPFFFSMKSRRAEDVEREQVVKNNDEDFLKRVGYRVLEVDNMYSLRAQQDKKDILLRGKSDNLYPRDLEDMAFNYTDPSSQNYGALYSQLIINKWRAAFSRNLGEKARMVWTDDGHWKRASEVDEGPSDETTA
jgi:hypothetical protein